MKAREIIEQLAREAVVETMLSKIAHRAFTGDLLDLAQMVYEALLTTPARTIVRLHRRDELQFYITKIITNQLRSKTSPFYYLFRIQDTRNVPITTEIENRHED